MFLIHVGSGMIEAMGTVGYVRRWRQNGTMSWGTLYPTEGVRHTGMSFIILPERHTHIKKTRHLAQGKHTDTHINALTHTHTQTHEHTNTHKYTIANTHTHNELQRLCRMDCLLCGVMFDNQVCNLLPSYRGPLRCIRLIYGQLYLTIIAILQNMCTGIPSHTCLHTTSSMLFLFPPIPTFPHLNGR